MEEYLRAQIKWKEKNEGDFLKIFYGFALDIRPSESLQWREEKIFCGRETFWGSSNGLHRTKGRVANHHPNRRTFSRQESF